jgi:hypothetical protein
MLEAAASSTFFNLRVEVVFERNTSCKSNLSKLGKAHFFQICLFRRVEKHFYLSIVCKFWIIYPILPCQLNEFE